MDIRFTVWDKTGEKKLAYGTFNTDAGHVNGSITIAVENHDTVKIEDGQWALVD